MPNALYLKKKKELLNPYMHLPPPPLSKWDRFSKLTKTTSNNLLLNQVTRKLSTAFIEGEVTIAKKRIELRLIFLVHVVAILVAFHFREYVQLGRVIVFSIYGLLLLRILTGIVLILVMLHRTRHTGVLHYAHRFFYLGGIRHPYKAFKACMKELFDKEYALFMKKPLIYMHKTLSENDLIISDEEIFNLFYHETMHHFWHFFRFHVVQFILSMIGYTIIAWLARISIFNATPLF